MDLFQLPKSLGDYKGEDILVNNGRFGPYIKFGDSFVSLPKGVDPLSIELDDAIVLIKEKQKADAPIYMYQDLPVQKGKGRFGPFIKWNNMFINVELPKTVDVSKMTLDEAKAIIEAKTPKKKTAKKKITTKKKATTKKK